MKKTRHFTQPLPFLLLLAAACVLAAGEAAAYTITINVASDPPGLPVPGVAMDGGVTTINAGGNASLWVRSTNSQGNEWPFTAYEATSHQYNLGGNGVNCANGGDPNCTPRVVVTGAALYKGNTTWPGANHFDWYQIINPTGNVTINITYKAKPIPVNITTQTDPPGLSVPAVSLDGGETNIYIGQKKSFWAHGATGYERTTPLYNLGSDETNSVFYNSGGDPACTPRVTISNANIKKGNLTWPAPSHFDWYRIQDPSAFPVSIQVTYKAQAIPVSYGAHVSGPATVHHGDTGHSITVTPAVRPGYAVSSVFATSGACTDNGNGTWTLAGVTSLSGTTVSAAYTDIEPPVITRTGPASVEIACGAPYTDDGATATDNEDGNLTAGISVSNPVNTGATGVYTVTYDVSDAAGNPAAQVTRTVTVVDTTAPVVTIDGGVSALSGECGVALALPGATASDVCDGAPAASVSDYDGLNEPAPAVGVYDVVYSATDAAGNTGTAVLTVTVDDTTAPVVTLDGGVSALAGACGVALALPGATASDTCDGPRAVSVSDYDGLNPAAPAVGVYDVVYAAADGSGNTGTAVLTVTVDDTTAPVVTLDGGVSTLSGACGAALALPGATAADACDGAPAASVSDYDGLNPAAPAVGVYDVVYAATDAAGNTGTAILTVTVDDTAAPVVTLDGGVSTLAGACGVALTLPDASVADACDGVFAASVSDYDGLNPAAPAVGVYGVVYSATDAAGNTGTAILTVTVDDTAAPVITIPGDNPAYVVRGTSYTAPTAPAFDACDGDLGSVTGSGTVDTSTLGAYDLTYTAQDAAGNTAVETLTVNVTDDLPPVIALVGDASVTLDCGDEYTDAGATASDDLDGDLTAQLAVSGLPPAGPLGPGSVYTVSYNVSDSGGKAAATVTRTVTVLDNCTLAVTASGGTSLTVAAGGRAEFAVDVTGAVGTAGFQWLRDDGSKAWAPLTGETSASLVLDPVAEGDAGSYLCAVSDGVTSVDSPVFTLAIGSGLPALGLLGLGALAAALGLGGAAASRRRRS